LSAIENLTKATLLLYLLINHNIFKMSFN